MRVSVLRVLVVSAVVCGAALATRGIAQERITLTVPETAPNNLTYRLDSVSFTLDDPNTASIDEGVMTIRLVGVERAISVSCIYNSATSPTGTATIIALNKANLSTAYANNATTGSLIQRIFHRLFSGGLNEGPAICGRALTGTLTGSPQ